jgi:UDP-3-O-acyl N-acetylglucosamine deacetylase
MSEPGSAPGPSSGLCSGPSRRREQRTIVRSSHARGVGFLTGADVTISFHPAPPGHGIAFQRTDLPGTRPVPATIEHAVPRDRRTAIAHDGVTVEMTEHVLAALVGLRIDNCLVQIDAPEPPGCDGSSRAFVEALRESGGIGQGVPRLAFTVTRPARLFEPQTGMAIAAEPIDGERLIIEYELDYGPASPIPPQTLSVEITPESFVAELAFARTFILESEIAALKAQGYGRRTTARDLIVYGAGGVIENELRAPDECVRHKILDCLGDFGLLGCDLFGRFSAVRSGHRLNREIVRQISGRGQAERPTASGAA